MGRQDLDRSRAGDAVSREAWPEAYRLLRDLPDPGPDDLDALADAAWWLCRVDESVTARQQAYRGYVSEGREREGARAAWMVFYEHHLAGHPGLAAGWLAQARRHLAGEPECLEHAYLALADSFLAMTRGAHEEAGTRAAELTRVATACGSVDLRAMGLQCQGDVLLAQGRVQEGLALVDQAVGAALAGELSSLFTGWIYCLALPGCYQAGDLRRAGEWAEAAVAWCSHLPAGTPFHGLCRVHRVQMLGLRGAWPEAEADAEQACVELAAYDERVAAEVYYVAGDLHRRRGHHAAAQEAYDRAHRLGRDPQPGLALLRLAEGQVELAVAALRTALAAGVPGTLDRAWLLAAAVEVLLAAGAVEEAADRAEDLQVLAQQATAEVVTAMAATARGAVALAGAEPGADPGADLGAGLRQLRRARELWADLHLPYEEARARMLLASAYRGTEDVDGERLELVAARRIFSRLGAEPDARRASALLGTSPGAPGGLSPREIEVLRLVAAGATNRRIADELVLSEHTVARHLNNIFAKLGVSSRASATAFACTHHLV